VKLLSFELQLAVPQLQHATGRLPIVKKTSLTGYQAQDFHKGHCPLLLDLLKTLGLDRTHSLYTASALLGQTPWPRDRVLRIGHSLKELAPKRDF